MALKDVLEDKKKKRTITIVGTIVIILVTAGVFAYEASSIEVKEPPSGGMATEEPTTTTPAAANETGDYHDERTGTVPGSGPGGIIDEDRPNQEFEPFPVNPGAKRLVVTVSSDKDIDLHIIDPDGNVVASSATHETTETVEIRNPSPAGEWNADILHWSIVPIPFNSADYYIVIDVYYD